MNKLFTLTKFYFSNPNSLIVFFAILISVVCWSVFYQLGLITSYSDAMSHLNLSRFVFDNLKPGLTQIGGVWLPLTHLLPLLFIWNDWAWHSGAAGSIFSMISYVLSVWAIYQIINLLTSHRLASFAGAFVFALNLNILYLQSTPLTESVFLAFFILSALFFLKWLIFDSPSYLLLIGVFGFLQVLTRYDGWFVVVFEAVLIGFVELFMRKHRVSEVLGKLFVMGAPVAFGIFLWLLWNQLIFGDVLFFVFGPYSAHAQQVHIAAKGGLLTEGNIFMSMLSYWFAIVNNIGYVVIFASVIGFLGFFIRNCYSLTIDKRGIFLLFLSAPIIFNVVALYLGFSILNLPELNWNPSNDPRAFWFNVRYGIFALPLVAFLVGIFAAERRLITTIIVVEAVILQIFIMLPNNVITIVDGTIGSSSFVNDDIADKLKEKAGMGDRVLLSISFFNPVAFKSGIGLGQVIHEGVGDMWREALSDPAKFADVIVIANGNVGDPVYEALVLKNKEDFLKEYTLLFAGKHANIYRLEGGKTAYK